LLLIAGLVLIGGNTMVVFCCQKLAGSISFIAQSNRRVCFNGRGGWLTRFLRFICGNLSAAIDKSSVGWKRLHSAQYFFSGPAHGVTSFFGVLSSPFSALCRRVSMEELSSQIGPHRQLRSAENSVQFFYDVLPDSSQNQQRPLLCPGPIKRGNGRNKKS
jgi:hypothetical protein